MSAYSAACSILKALMDAFEAEGRLPSRCYVADGSALMDFSECLIVEWEQTAAQGFSSPLGLQVADMSMGILPLEATFSIHVGRYCVWPDEAGTPPTPEEIGANAHLVHCDAQLVIDTLLAGIKDGTLIGGCNSATFRGQQTFGPDGGIVGSVTAITVTL